MRNLIIFIRRYFNFFLFLVILIFCLSLVVSQNNYQRTSFINSANGISGYFFRKYSHIQYYFHLKAVNDSLVVQNAALLNQLPDDFMSVDTSSILHKDSTGKRQYFYLSAPVINNSVNSLTNYITLYRGSKQGMEEGMGVVGPQGIVGIVRKVSPNYSVVMSMLNKNMSISAKLLNTGNFGSVKWETDHPDPRFGMLTDIPKNVHIQSGDSVVTSGYSAIFPPGILIGYIDRVSELTSSNFLKIRIRFATHFRSLQYVYVIKNFNSKEQTDLESAESHE